MKFSVGSNLHQQLYMNAVRVDVSPWEFWEHPEDRVIKPSARGRLGRRHREGDMETGLEG